jgi:hypothetical protein
MMPMSVNLLLGLTEELNKKVAMIERHQAFSDWDKENISHAVVYLCDALDCLDGRKIEYEAGQQ